jgi:hypothetical protein
MSRMYTSSDPLASAWNVVDSFTFTSSTTPITTVSYSGIESCRTVFRIAHLYRKCIMLRNILTEVNKVQHSQVDSVCSFCLLQASGYLETLLGHMRSNS